MEINCENQDLSFENAIRSLIVNGTDEPYFNCDNQNITLEDILRLLITEDSDGKPAIRVSIKT